MELIACVLTVAYKHLSLADVFAMRATCRCWMGLLNTPQGFRVLQAMLSADIHRQNLLMTRSTLAFHARVLGVAPVARRLIRVYVPADECVPLRCALDSMTRAYRRRGSNHLRKVAAFVRVNTKVVAGVGMPIADIAEGTENSIFSVCHRHDETFTDSTQAIREMIVAVLHLPFVAVRDGGSRALLAFRWHGFQKQCTHVTGPPIGFRLVVPYARKQVTLVSPESPLSVECAQHRAAVGKRFCARRRKRVLGD